MGRVTLPSPIMYNQRVERSKLLEHIRKTHFSPGDSAKARLDAQRIATYLRSMYDVRVIGIGSLFSATRTFKQSSDIDLVVDGIPPVSFFAAAAASAAMTEFSLDLIPMESASPLIHQRIAEEGVEL